MIFTWDKSLKKLDVPAERILHVFQSMRDVQLALPGQPVQQATAYLCQYQQGAEVATVAVFHMRKIQTLAFYRSKPAAVAADKADAMLDNGLSFVESMGFLLADMDLHLLDNEDRAMLWESLPLTAGLTPAEPAAEPLLRSGTKVPVSTSVETPTKQATTTRTEGASPAADQPPSQKTTEIPETVAFEEPEELEPIEDVEDVVEDVEEVVADDAADDSVDDLLAAVEALRAKRPALRARRKMPNSAEMQKRRLALRENLGRILSSL